VTYYSRLPLKECYDLIIVGSGAGGCTLAYKLAKAGLRILMIERGEFLRPQRGSGADAIGKYQHHFSDAERLSVVGGQTKFYGSALYRMRETDFEAIEHENGTSSGWPIGYSDLEPYYQEAELLYRVHGSSEVDATEPWRTGPLPYPAIEHSPVVADMVRRLGEVGAKVSPIPLGLDYGLDGKCVLCSTCDGHYCQIDAKMDAEVAALRPALATGNLDLITSAECLRVLTNEGGTRVTGVLVRYVGDERMVCADGVAVCAGIPGSALLLRRSRTNRHPDGLGNAYGCLGRYLAGHSVGLIFVLAGWGRLPPAHTKTFGINTYYHGVPGWPHPMGVIQVAGQMPFWERSRWFLRPAVEFVGARSVICFWMTEALPDRNTGFTFERDEIRYRVAPIHNPVSFTRLRKVALSMFRRAGYIALPVPRPHQMWHETGTARMGADPKSSVTDANCQVHGIDGLFVVDASALPSAGAVNTGLTIFALALRVGDHIAKRFGGRPDGVSRASNHWGR
jgi:choline dehydrogenase-like flavoprotein